MILRGIKTNIKQDLIMLKRANYKNNCIKMYDNNVKRYIDSYRKDFKEYPGNQMRLKILLGVAKKKKPKRLLYVGCGPAIPMIKIMQQTKCDARGIDFSKEMIKGGREQLKKRKIGPFKITLGDIEKLNTMPKGKFDFAVAAGVFSHLAKDELSLVNLNRKLTKNATVLVEFRNNLFSLFSFNRYSYDFFVNSLLAKIKPNKKIKNKIELFFKNKFDILRKEKVAPRSTAISNGVIKKFHNPLKINKLFEKHGFRLERNYFYHYHVLPPGSRIIGDALYDKVSLSLEDPLDWRGNLMASAFVSEAIKIKNV